MFVDDDTIPLSFSSAAGADDNKPPLVVQKILLTTLKSTVGSFSNDMKISTALLIAAAACGMQEGAAFSSTRTARRSTISLGVASHDIEKEIETAADAATGDEAVPYVVARGDGSTGGGGVAMPHDTDEDGLRRPKVNAEMPEG